MGEIGFLLHFGSRIPGETCGICSSDAIIEDGAENERRFRLRMNWVRWSRKTDQKT